MNPTVRSELAQQRAGTSGGGGSRIDDFVPDGDTDFFLDGGASIENGGFEEESSEEEVVLNPMVASIEDDIHDFTEFRHPRYCHSYCDGLWSLLKRFLKYHSTTLVTPASPDSDKEEESFAETNENINATSFGSKEKRGFQLFVDTTTVTKTESSGEDRRSSDGGKKKKKKHKDHKRTKKSAKKTTDFEEFLGGGEPQQQQGIDSSAYEVL